MRKTNHDGNLTMRAFAGTHVVLLGWSMTKLKSRRVLGFAVHRTDHTEGEAFWLKGIKVFEETDPGTAQASLRSHPVQGFTLVGLHGEAWSRIHLPCRRPERTTLRSSRRGLDRNHDLY